MVRPACPSACGVWGPIGHTTVYKHSVSGRYMDSHRLVTVGVTNHANMGPLYRLSYRPQPVILGELVACAPAPEAGMAAR